MVVSPHRHQPAESGREPLGLLTTSSFIEELHQRLAMASDHIAIQLMTFDGDRSGLEVAALLRAAAERGVVVRLLVDSFAMRFVSDQPVDRREVRAEFEATLDMFDGLRAAGVELRFTNANGPANLFALARNHKKLYVIDDAVYLGGINVSDHNFEWHDFMVRLDHAAIRAAILADFDDTFAGRRTTIDTTIDSQQVTIVTNGAIRLAFDRMIAEAEQRVVVASPYALDRRLATVLESCSAPMKSIVIADHNNFRFLQAITPYLVDRVAADGVELLTYSQFSHSKFLLVDDNRLLVGSSNFGRHSLTCNQEIGLIIRDRSFIKRFESEFLVGLESAELSSNAAQRLFGRVATAGMEGYLMAYARLIAPRVPLLARPSNRRRTTGVETSTPTK